VSENLPFPYNCYDQDMFAIWPLQLIFLLGFMSGNRWRVSFLPGDGALFCRDFPVHWSTKVGDGYFTDYHYVYWCDLIVDMEATNAG
jgi:hypothetical protein